jgi:hypothetical protein
VAADPGPLFERVAERLLAADGGVERGKIMNAIGLKTGGKFFAFVSRGVLVLKLPAARVDELVAAGAQRFDAGKGRPMREWVEASPADEAECAALVDEARAFVGGAASARDA